MLSAPSVRRAAARAARSPAPPSWWPPLPLWPSSGSSPGSARQDLAPDHSGAALVAAAVLATVVVGVAWWRAPRADFVRTAGLACLPALLGLALAPGAEARFAYLTL